MTIKEVIYSNNRNDFKAIFKCPICGAEYEAWGYKDYNFFHNVMPNAVCRECKTNSLGETEAELDARDHYVYRI